MKYAVSSIFREVTLNHSEETHRQNVPSACRLPQQIVATGDTRAQAEQWGGLCLSQEFYF